MQVTKAAEKEHAKELKRIEGEHSDEILTLTEGWEAATAQATETHNLQVSSHAHEHGTRLCGTHVLEAVTLAVRLVKVRLRLLCRHTRFHGGIQCCGTPMVTCCWTPMIDDDLGVRLRS